MYNRNIKKITDDLLPRSIEVWCCPGKQDDRIRLYLDGAMRDYHTQKLGFVYRRYGNGDFYTQVKNRDDMFTWLNDPENEAEPKIIEG